MLIIKHEMLYIDTIDTVHVDTIDIIQQERESVKNHWQLRKVLYK